MIASLRMNIPPLAASIRLSNNTITTVITTDQLTTRPQTPSFQTRRLEAIRCWLRGTDGGGAHDIWGKRSTVKGRVVEVKFEIVI